MRSKALLIGALGLFGLGACAAIIGIGDVPTPIDASDAGTDARADVIDASAPDTSPIDAAPCIKPDAGPWGNPDCCGVTSEACHTGSCYMGSCVRLVFVTSAAFPCDFLDGGTDPCGALTPTDPPLVGKKFAMLASGGGGVMEATTHKYDLVRGDGKLVVAPFSGNISNAMTRDELGMQQPGGDVWSGYTAGLVAGADCAGWKNITMSAQGGNMVSTSNWVWIDKGSMLAGQNFAHLYCVERDRF